MAVVRGEQVEHRLVSRQFTGAAVSRQRLTTVVAGATPHERACAEAAVHSLEGIFAVAAALVLGTRRDPALADGVEQAARCLRPGAPLPAVPAVTRRDDTEEGLLLAALTLSAVQLRQTQAALR